ncbi:prostamide/prostaglandin F synthase-like [Tigriopus californicus]|uniref:prostamide/prostaglandin F synthase-like n=1 Tax=Tigriopus californicus TaxID=6832 RepID=UPI0027D9E33D|nr:prostamide/prostaglandin F synthase-like [Tigriopus californicus]
MGSGHCLFTTLLWIPNLVSQFAFIHFFTAIFKDQPGSFRFCLYVSLELASWKQVTAETSHSLLDRKSYRDLGFHQMSGMDLVPGLLSPQALSAGFNATLSGLGGNMWGNGMQNGGLLVVERGGNKVPFSFRQNQPSDHPDRKAILDALNIPHGERLSDERSSS